KPLVEGGESLVRRLVGHDAELHRQMRASSLELTQMVKAQAGNRACRNRGGTQAIAERRDAALFIVVLHEPRRLPLIIGIRREVGADVAGRSVPKVVVEMLVVREVESE